MAEATINSQTDGELEIAQRSWSNTFEPKRPQGRYGDTLRLAPSSVLHKPLPDRLAIFLATFSLSITLMWFCFLAWIAIRLWHKW